MSVADYRKQQGLGPAQVAPKRAKYCNQRTVGQGGRTYDSKAEARRADELEQERMAGLIVGWRPQVSFPIGTDEKGRTVRYVADFFIVERFTDDGKMICRIEDKKGRDTTASRAKRAALREHGVEVELV